MARLIIPENPRRDRCTVNGRDLHCGDPLDLLLPGGAWVPVRFEMHAGAPVLYMGLGGSWESWKPPAGVREGQEYQRACEDCDGSGKLEVGDRCPSCTGKGRRYVVARDRETGEDRSGERTCDDCSGSGKVDQAHAGPCGDCNGTGRRWTIADRPGAPQVMLSGDALTRAELRHRVRT